MKFRMGLRISTRHPATDGSGETIPTIYYVDWSTGNDNNDGTIDFPWKTTAKVEETTLNPGDWVLFKGGSAWSTNLTLDAAKHNGISGSKTLFGAYGTGKPIFYAQTNGDNGLHFAEPEYVTITDLMFEGTGISTSTAHGIYICRTASTTDKKSGVSLINLEATKFGLSGIQVEIDFNISTSGNPGFDGLLIEGCSSYDNSGNSPGGTGSGIEVVGYYGAQEYGHTHSNVTITGCTVYGNTGKAGNDGWSGSGIHLAQTDVGLIENCLAHTNCSLGGVTGFAGGFGIWTMDSRAVVIRSCSSYENTIADTADDGGGFALEVGSVNCIIEKCYSRDNDGAGFKLNQSFNFSDVYPLSGCQIRHNISENDGARPSSDHACIIVRCSIEENQSGNYVYNNTVFSNRASGVALGIPNSGYNEHLINGGIFNNIFILTGSGSKFIKAYNSVLSSTQLIEGNLYHTTDTVSFDWGGSTYTTISSWKTASGKEALNAELSDDPETYSGLLALPTNIPGMINTAYFKWYQLDDGSPALSAGVDVNSFYGLTLGTTDFFGDTITDVNIGCYGGAGVAKNYLPNGRNLFTGAGGWLSYELVNTPGALSLDGSTNASYLAPTAVDDAHYTDPYEEEIYVTGAEGRWEYGGIFKDDGARYIDLSIYDVPDYESGYYASIDFQTGEIWEEEGYGPKFSNFEASFTEVVTGWWLLELKFDVASGVDGFNPYIQLVNPSDQQWEWLGIPAQRGIVTEMYLRRIPS